MIRDKEQCIFDMEKCMNIHKTGITAKNSGGGGVLKTVIPLMEEYSKSYQIQKKMMIYTIMPAELMV